MPELPEVEITCRGIEPALQGQAVTEVRVRQPRLRYPVPEDLAERLPGQVVRAVRRRAPRNVDRVAPRYLTCNKCTRGARGGGAARISTRLLRILAQPAPAVQRLGAADGGRAARACCARKVVDAERIGVVA